ncbi:MAG: GNAT family N-acetyltransferase [Lachnospiraceae bacterium]|nr:GNAT family N-acetyltransferase [Lachnospiraceae bacterium]
MIRSADIRHKNQIKAMYERIFSDPKKFTEYYFEERMIPERVLISADNSGKVISMLSRNAKHLSVGEKLFDADYIYAVAVDNEYRGQGLSRDMVNKAVELSAKEGTYFTYLIPVDEKIYKGNGFVTIRNSGEISLRGTGAKEDVRLEELNGRYYDSKHNIIRELVEFSADYNHNILEKNIIATYKDEAYFKVMLNQIDAEDSSIVIIRKSEKIKGYAIINGHKERQSDEIRICDYVVEPDYEFELAERIKIRYNINNIKFIYNKVMAKVTSPYFLENLNATEDKVVYIKLEDDNKIYEVNSLKGKVSISEREENLLSQTISLNLREITEFVFGMREIEGMPKMECLEGITVNEEV